MSVALRTTIAVAAITVVAVVFGVVLDLFIRIAPFHGPSEIATQLAIAAVVPLWAYAVRSVILAAVRDRDREPSLR
ncbi:hypothetical protein [Demequina lignilytica]|uniref:Uncharacterized protein n=1 Tax=Demequina lignilytica TaxID=3051663 RepID=A0AAW7M8Y5_9MICO|nr:MULTISPECIES: hypothetical protein [unclassified Demequina]MDN4477273.1 hypothetical protein [Demequina sp. SYSU T00039-1]MDN4483800.1 hypothetical protein [Demequina sp. SYSU T0a273]MDN4487446.1 hypothetical protein [Demequina sp. SYSU T00039]MDN4491199.1 hypothetical protein [Demequina sp. SYSU T00068]